MNEYIPTLCAPGYPQDIPKMREVEGFGVWFITYHRPFRPDEAGIKFVNGEAEAKAEAERLKAYGYFITEIAPTSKTSAGRRSELALPIQ